MLSFWTLAHPARGGAVLMAAAVFGLGVAAGAFVRSDAILSRPAESASAAFGASTPRGTIRGEPSLAGHPAEVLRVIDGDTFEARVRVWPGLDITTKVRLRGIDAPEMRARCEQEFRRAEAARVALATLLAEGRVTIARVDFDKYGGRVVADAATPRTPDVSRALLVTGLVRSYDGGRRRSWCGATRSE
jgi:endonuclease YncB( thermonuclease family)